MKRLAVLALLLASGCNGCSRDLTDDEVAQYQDCVVDGDCVVDNQSCSDCTAVAINRGQQRDFEAERGCWPDPQPLAPCTQCKVGKCFKGRCGVGNAAECTVEDLVAAADGGGP